MVIDKVLVIQNYRLSTTHCEAIHSALKCLLGQKHQIISSIVLENNELKDEGIAEIIDGLDNIRFIEKVILKRNHVGPLTIHNL